MSRGAAKNFLKRKKETLTTTTTETNKKIFNVQRHFSCSVVFETFGKISLVQTMNIFSSLNTQSSINLYWVYTRHRFR